HLLLGDPEPILGWSEEMVARATEQGFAYLRVVGKILRGWALADQGRPEGMIELRQAIVERRGSGTRGLASLFGLGLIDACQKAGRFEEARAALEDELSRVAQCGDRHLEAELHRLRGECLLKLAPARPEEAETCFLQAIKVARGQGAKMLELRAALSLSRL